MKSITNYFRNSLAAQMNAQIDFKNDFFRTVSVTGVENGIIDCPKSSELFQHYIKYNRSKEEIQIIPVLIALKTISTKIVDSKKGENDVDELSAIFYLPANLDVDGNLAFPDETKSPWFVREYLEPMIDAELSIGKADDFDVFLQNNIDEKNQIDSWRKYLQYARHMYEYVTKSSFSSDSIENLVNSKLDNKIYVFIDSTINASFHVMNLYNHIREETPSLPLYDNFINMKEAQPRPLLDNSDLSMIKKHSGQMGGEYPLSPSQREALIHFNEITNGEILAVNGPPGTGKTTLLQSIVANMITDHALQEKDAPIIVASSTNNQAVTNIIDSFGNIKSTGIDNLENRWICSVDSFATYFPSKGKEKEAKEKKYQYIDGAGKNFIRLIDSEENILESKTKLIEECNAYFTQKFKDVIQCKDKLLIELKSIERIRLELIDNLELIQNITNNTTICEYIDSLELKINDINNVVAEKKQITESLFAKRATVCERITEWENSYKKLSWTIRMFKFLQVCKNKIYNWSCVFKNIDETEFFIGDLLLEEIQTKYREKINLINIEINKIKQQTDNLIKKMKGYCDAKDQILSLRQMNFNIVDKFNNHHIDLLSKDYEKRYHSFENGEVKKINDILDFTVRYVEFWLSVHYYECRWLDEKAITDRQLDTNIGEVLDKIYHRLALVSPCMVMTFYMLPKLCLAYNMNEKKAYYMYNYIDLLIVDEAGQTSPEIAAASFSLAKKAVVVGDEKQIPPVWGISNALDISMAIKHGVISTSSEFDTLKKNGLNTSQSSVMKVASYSCPYNKYDKGLFLSEHRRCYDDIIEYCNELIYNGRLEPLRGSANSENNPIKSILPAMGFMDIQVNNSQKNGCSRHNTNEAEYIINWLIKNYASIADKYLKNDSNVKENEIFGIISPFKSQVKKLQELLKNKSTENSQEFLNNINVGTVHTFQGAERKIIIFSTTYGSEDGCFFIDKNDSLMNVAVSRAKDSFLVFGARNCLSDNDKSASGLLKKYCNNELKPYSSN